MQVQQAGCWKNSHAGSHFYLEFRHNSNVPIVISKYVDVQPCHNIPNCSIKNNTKQGVAAGILKTLSSNLFSLT